MFKKIVLIFCFLLLSASCDKPNQTTAAVPSPSYNYSHKLQVGNQTLMAEVAKTPAQMQQGLSDRSSMDDSQGMLFDFGAAPARTTFWMKAMKFDLDFIWIADGKIIGITPDAARPNSPNDPLPTYNSPMPVNQVLEVNAGWAKKNGIIVGDEASLLQ